MSWHNRLDSLFVALLLDLFQFLIVAGQDPCPESERARRELSKTFFRSKNDPIAVEIERAEVAAPQKAKPSNHWKSWVSSCSIATWSFSFFIVVMQDPCPESKRARRELSKTFNRSKNDQIAVEIEPGKVAAPKSPKPSQMSENPGFYVLSFSILLYTTPWRE